MALDHKSGTMKDDLKPESASRLLKDDLKSSNVALDRKSVTMKGDFKPESASRSLKILSYNVWFREDLELYKRMQALGDLIQLHSPDLICFQVS